MAENTTPAPEKPVKEMVEEKSVEENGAAGWRMVAVICGVIGLVVNTISCLCVKELPEEGSAAVDDTQKPKDDKIGFVESLKLLISNKYYILIVAIYIVYYFKMCIRDRSWDMIPF